MSDDETATSLQEALRIASEEIGFLEFDSKNTQQGYKYMSAAAVFRKINKVFAEVGLTVSSEKELVHHGESLDSKGRTQRYAVVKTTLKVFFYDEDHKTFSYRTTTGFGSGVDLGDKAVAKAETMAEKYCYAHLLILGWGAEDPEADPKTDIESKVELTSEEIASRISNASSIGELKALHAPITGRKGRPDYDNLMTLYKQTRSALQATK